MTDIMLNKPQNEVKDGILKFVYGPQGKPLHVCGPAGSGKTTLLKHMIDKKAITPLILAPSHKAIAVIRSKIPNYNNDNIKTVQSFTKQIKIPKKTDLEITIENKEREYKELDKNSDRAMALEKKIKRLYLERNNATYLPPSAAQEVEGVNVVICDESSMVSEEQYKSIVNNSLPVIFMGDDAQLLPVAAKPCPFMSDQHYILDRVVRQNADSEILKYATAIRGGDLSTNLRDKEDCRVIDYSLSIQEMVKFDVIITNIHDEINKISKKYREYKGLSKISPFPQKGERIYTKEGNSEIRTNDILTVTSDFIDLGDRIQLDVKDDAGNEHLGICMKKDFFIGLQDDGDRQEFDKNIDAKMSVMDKLKKEAEKLSTGTCYEMRYAYAITCYAAQGSEWENVLYHDIGYIPNDMFAGRTTKQRAIYTSITRATKHVTHSVLR